MNNNHHNELKLKLIGLLDQFVKVCEDNHLQYYLAYGTVLGAIRHHGMIPWDDDIDVHMPRSDYEKLQTLPDSVWNEYELTSWKRKAGNQYHFLKLEDPNTTLIEVFDPIYIGGIYIDIFPLDDVPQDKSQYERQIKTITEIKHKYDILCIRHGSDCKGIINFIKYKWRLYNILHQHIQEQWDRASVLNVQHGDNVMDYHVPQTWHYAPMPRDWFGKGKLAEYEGKKYIIPENYDAYLTHIYGDYMTPPPEDKRSAHEYLYVNLDRRITGAERDDVICSLRKRLSFRLSLADEKTYWSAKLGRK